MLGRRTHITGDMYFMGRGTHHITREMCLLGRRTHNFLSLGICVSWVGEHINYSCRVICFLGRETHITRDMCFPGTGRQITSD